MKTKLLCIFSLLLLMTQSILADDNQKLVNAKLTSATVFFKGAELQHSINTALTKGENELRIEGLSSNIDINSLKIKASNGVLISAFEYSVDYLTEKEKIVIDTKKLQDSIEQHKDLLRMKEAEITVINELIGILKKSTDKNISGSEKGLPIDDLMKTMAYYQSQGTELAKKLANDHVLIASYQETISKLENKIREASVKKQKIAGVLKLNLAAPLAANCNVTVSYYTSMAGWVPYYDFNIASTSKPIKITSKAKVRQTTGIDWQNVKLTLSTATPSNGKIAPLFNAWFLDEMRIPVTMGRSNNMAQNSFSYLDAKLSKNDELKEVVVSSIDEYYDSPGNHNAPIYIVDGRMVSQDEYGSVEQSMVKSQDYVDGSRAVSLYGSNASGGAYVITLKSSMDDYISVSDNLLNTEYNIDVPFSVPASGKEQSIDLLTQEIDAEYKYYSAPRLAPETFLLAEISNWEKLNLLTGKANVTFDGTYVGESFIDAASTHQKMTLTLGTEKRLTVKREKLQDYNSGTKLFGNDVKQTFTYRITVKNNQNKAVKMVLKDQYPISTKKGIEVELLKKETTTPTFDKEDIGVITWEETLNPGETKVYEISYSVKYPKGMNLNL